eukprot:207635_1
MRGVFKRPNNLRRRALRELMPVSIDIPSVRKSKLPAIHEELTMFDEHIGELETFACGESTDIESVHYLDEMKDERECESDERTANTNTKIFAVFVCGPDPMQCVEDPTAPNQRGQTYVDLLRNDDDDEEWREYMIYRNEFPSTRDLASFSAIIITGSKHDAYTDDEPWKLQLQLMIRDIYYNRRTIKLLGVCFGHQIIIHSLRNSEDDVVGRNRVRNKMEIGLVSVDLNDKFHAFWNRFDIKVDGNALRIHEAHQDVVYRLPAIPDAEVMAQSTYTDIEMYHIGDNIVGLQGHPEFTTAYITTAMQRNTKYMSRIYTQQQIQQILQNMRQNEANREEWRYILGKWIRI